MAAPHNAVAEQRACPRQSSGDRSGAPAKAMRSLVTRELFEVAEDDRHAVFFRQTVDLLVERLPQVLR